MSDIQHGTYAAYQKCKKRPEGPCEACRAAAAAYTRDYRANHPGARSRDRWWNNTRNAALERLAREYPERLQQILDEERAEGSPYVPGQAAS